MRSISIGSCGMPVRAQLRTYKFFAFFLQEESFASNLCTPFFNSKSWATAPQFSRPYLEKSLKNSFCRAGYAIGRSPASGGGEPCLRERRSLIFRRSGILPDHSGILFQRSLRYCLTYVCGSHIFCEEVYKKQVRGILRSG